MCNQCEELIGKSGITSQLYDYSFDNVGIGNISDPDNSYTYQPLDPVRNPIVPADAVAPGDPFDALSNNNNYMDNFTGVTPGNSTTGNSSAVVNPTSNSGLPMDVGSFADLIGSGLVSGGLGTGITPTIERGITGVVLDEYGEGIFGATIRINDTIYTGTDENGMFSFSRLIAPINAKILYQDNVHERTLGKYNEITLNSELLDETIVNAAKSKFPWVWVILGTVTVGGIIAVTSNKTVKATI